nr:MAG TPA: hypothetical protein [Caudoviricetes sp.]
MLKDFCGLLGGEFPVGNELVDVLCLCCGCECHFRVSFRLLFPGPVGLSVGSGFRPPPTL